MTHGFVNSIPYFEMLGFSDSAASYASYKASIAAIEPITVINYSMKKSSGGLGLMVPDESTRFTPKKAKLAASPEATADAAAPATADATGAAADAETGSGGAVAAMMQAVAH